MLTWMTARSPLRRSLLLASAPERWNPYPATHAEEHERSKLMLGFPGWPMVLPVLCSICRRINSISRAYRESAGLWCLPTSVEPEETRQLRTIV